MCLLEEASGRQAAVSNHAKRERGRGRGRERDGNKECHVGTAFFRLRTGCESVCLIPARQQQWKVTTWQLVPSSTRVYIFIAAALGARGMYTYNSIKASARSQGFLVTSAASSSSSSSSLLIGLIPAETLLMAGTNLIVAFYFTTH